MELLLTKMFSLTCTSSPATRAITILSFSLSNSNRNLATVSVNTPTLSSARTSAARIAAAREAEKSVGRPIALLADLQGPKLRIGDIAGGQCDVRMSSELRLRAAATSNDPDIIPIPHPELVASLQLGDKLLIDDGKMMLHLVRVDGDDRIAKVCEPESLREVLAVRTGTLMLRDEPCLRCREEERGADATGNAPGKELRQRGAFGREC